MSFPEYLFLISTHYFQVALTNEAYLASFIAFEVHDQKQILIFPVRASYISHSF